MLYEVITNLILFYDAFQQSQTPELFWLFLAYSVLDTSAVLFGLVSLSQYNWGRRGVSMALILAGLVTLTATDTFASHAMLTGDYATIAPMNGLYLLCFAFIRNNFV